MSGKKAAGIRVELLARPFGTPFFRPVSATRANAAGFYRFLYRPLKNTTLRTVANTAPRATSVAAAIKVRVKVGLSFGTLRPRAGQRVRVRGIVSPAAAVIGRRALLQRRAADGKWVVMLRIPLVAAAAGPFGARSQYFARVKIRRTDRYRVRVVPVAGWLANDSRIRLVTVK